MAGTFALKNLLTASKGRAASLQGGGTFVGGGAVSLGTSQELASSIVNEYNTTVVETVKQIHLINITDLLALDPQTIDETNLYRVYSSGSTETGWHEGGAFVLDGETYDDGTYFQYINNQWQEITDEVDLSKTLRFDNLPDVTYMIEGLHTQTSYANIYGRTKAGMKIATVGRYQLDDDGNYKPLFETTGTPGGGTSSNYLFSIVVPYARSYMDNGEMHYRGGVLDDEDYQLLKELIISGGEKVFFATYGVTSFEDVKDAHDEGKVVFVREGTTIAVLNYFYVNAAYFSCLINDGTYGRNLVHYYTLTFADGWSSTTDYVQSSRALVKSVDLADRYITDNYYLTALAVKTLIDNAGGNVNIDTSVPQEPANDHVPATALMVTLLAGRMDTDASNATNAAVQNLLDTLTYTSISLTDDDTLVMNIDSAGAYKEVPITSLADYIAAPVLSSPASGSISNFDGKVIFQSNGAQRKISAVLSPIEVNTAKHSASVGASAANGDYSFACGYSSTASGYYSFACGQYSIASGTSSACFGGYGNIASGQNSVCYGGSDNTASALCTAASGFYALADHDHMTAIGKYSRGWTASCTAHGISAAGSDYLLFTVGSGSGPNARKNSFEVWSTDEAYIGDRGVSTLYTITIEGTDSDSVPSSVTYCKGLEHQGWSFTGDWNVFFSAINCGREKASVSDWFGSHVFTVFYHDLDSDNIYSSPSDIGLTLGFHQSGAIWLPQVNLTDKTFFKNKNYKCVIQFTGI